MPLDNQENQQNPIVLIENHKSYANPIIPHEDYENHKQC